MYDNKIRMAQTNMCKKLYNYLNRFLSRYKETCIYIYIRSVDEFDRLIQRGIEDIKTIKICFRTKGWNYLSIHKYK